MGWWEQNPSECNKQQSLRKEEKQRRVDYWGDTSVVEPETILSDMLLTLNTIYYDHMLNMDNLWALG